MVFGEGEAQQLIEILTEKAGGAQDTWHTVRTSFDLQNSCHEWNPTFHHSF